MKTRGKERKKERKRERERERHKISLSSLIHIDNKIRFPVITRKNSFLSPNMFQDLPPKNLISPTLKTQFSQNKKIKNCAQCWSKIIMRLPFQIIVQRQQQ